MTRVANLQAALPNFTRSVYNGARLRTILSFRRERAEDNFSGFCV